MGQAGHMHAEAMLRYAHDATYTMYPWSWWRVRLASNDASDTHAWQLLEGHPTWSDELEYMRDGGAPEVDEPRPGYFEPMPAPIMTLEQAINLYHAAFLPDVVGATTDGEVFRETPASALARHLGLPHYVFATRAPGAKQTLDREAAADILHGWARALKA